MSSFCDVTSIGKGLVVGGGAWGTNVIRTLDGLGALGGICEMNDERRQQLAPLFPNVPLFATLDSMLQEIPSLPVFVTTPPFTHHAVASQALLAGRDVLVEKPMTVSSADAQRLIDLANARERVLMVGHLLLYNPAIEALKASLGDLGRVLYLHFQRLNLGRIRREENVLWSFAPHDIAVMLHLLDEWPDRVSCLGSGFVQPDVEDVALMHLQFPSGTLASIQVGWLEPVRVRTLKVIGDIACAVVDELANPPLTIMRHQICDQTLKTEKLGADSPHFGDVEPLRQECIHFLQCVQQRTRPRSPGEQGLAVVHILECATQSLRNRGEWVEVKHNELRSRISASR